MEEASNACRLHLTHASAKLGEIPFEFNTNTNNPSGSVLTECSEGDRNGAVDWTSAEGETLTDRDAVTDVELNSAQSSLCPKDPVFGYKIHQAMSQIVGKDVFDVAELGSVSRFVQSHIEWGLEPGSFLVTNLSVMVEQFKKWKEELPMVDPFYAVKCNPDPVVLRLLASLGCGFDCATMGEIDLVLNGLGEQNLGARGLASTAIVYANPAKMNNHVQFAIDNEVGLTVFDGEDELKKLAKIDNCHKLGLLLRLSTNDSHSVCVFSHKFGCPVQDSPRLLKLAKDLGLNVVGVSFHVGSGCRDANTYTEALDDTFKVFETARELGMQELSVVDIGGGFPGDTGGYGGDNMPTFCELAAVIRAGIEGFKSKVGSRASEVRFIAEPGRYFASAATSVATKVYARKGGDSDLQALYVDDGVYGTFNNVLYDHASPVPSKVVSASNAVDAKEIPTTVFGPTCDGLDQMCDQRTTHLPRCEINDWLLWENMGAYTHTASFVFNGYTHVPNRIHFVL